MPEGYTVSITREGMRFIVTNTQDEEIPPTTSIRVKKVWEDKDDAAKKRPASIQVVLYQGDTPYGDAVTLSEENQWSHAWEELPESADWREDEITDVKEYKKQVSQRGTTFTITNTYKEPILPQKGLLWWPVPLLLIAGFAMVGVLIFPSLGLKLPVASQWSYENLQKAPCLYAGTAYLHNMVICAHNYSDHFGRIEELKNGEEVRFLDMAGNSFVYQVASVEILRPTAIESMVESEYPLSLFTCTWGGQTRLTVRCASQEDGSH